MIRKINILNKDYENSNIPLLITEPTGFGSNFELQEVGGRPYGFKPKFENITFNINFGINRNAYADYNYLVNFLKDNEAVIEYDWGDGVRYTDVRILNAPKTEKEIPNLLVSKFSFCRLTHWYKLVEINSSTYPFISEEITNETSELAPVYFKYSGVPSAFTISVGDEIVRFSTNVRMIEIDAFNKKVIYESEDNQILNGYDLLRKDYNSFIYIPEGTHQIKVTNASNTTIMNFKILIKLWVND